MEQPLNSVPRDTLGFVCYNLAQKGWRELAFTTGQLLIFHVINKFDTVANSKLFECLSQNSTMCHRERI